MKPSREDIIKAANRIRRSVLGDEEQLVQLYFDAYRTGMERAAVICEGRIGGAVKQDQWWQGFKSAMKQCADAIRKEMDEMEGGK